MIICSRLLSSTVALALLAACGSTASPLGGTGSASGAGGALATGSSGSSTSGAGGSSSSCAQAKTMLDVSKAPGPGGTYPKPTLSATCTATTFVVESNGIPSYTFEQITPNALKANKNHWEIPLNPKVASQSTAVPLAGYAGFAVDGVPFFGPNEDAIPADEAYGDPVYNGIMDPCFGHTSPNDYHFHSLLEKCLVPSGLVATPWKNADPTAGTASPIVAWAADGFAVYGSRECADASCAKVVVLQSGYVKIGNPKTYAWKAYQWKANADTSYLDECNGHVGPKGDYHYHATTGFPYILGCFKGTPAGIMSGGMMSGSAGSGGVMGPKACTGDADCAGACPPQSAGCGCRTTPMGKTCAPTCTVDKDCPPGPMGQTFSCKQGYCGP